MRLGSLAVALTILSGLAGLAAAAEDAPGLLAYGRHLARECTACHRLDGTDRGIPSITGWDAEQLAATLKFYQTGARVNPVMVTVAKSLDDRQVRALALYYATLPKPAGKPQAPPADEKTQK
jgi:cytochrome c553